MRFLFNAFCCLLTWAFLVNLVFEMGNLKFARTFCGSLVTIKYIKAWIVYIYVLQEESRHCSKVKNSHYFCTQLHTYKFKVKLKLIWKLLSWSFQFSLGTVLLMFKILIWDQIYLNQPCLILKWVSCFKLPTRGEDLGKLPSPLI